MSKFLHDADDRAMTIPRRFFFKTAELKKLDSLRESD